MILLLLACGGDPPADEPAESVAPKPVAEAIVHSPASDPNTPQTPGGAVPVELQFAGVGALHQRYFADDDILVALSETLGACVQDRAVVRVEYDNDTRIGKIRILEDAKQLTCHSTRSANTVDVSALAPLGKALASYRDTIAARFDFRIASFKIELEAVAGTHGCLLTLGGQFPPDGSTWSSCPTLGGESKCGGPKRDGVSVFAFESDTDAAYLNTCLGG